ncbi:MAG: Ig-like domain-containing protein [Bacteroidales bacterium]|nr:Ig-like domain-containing protein [Bacteroidales bacterium]
MNSKIRLFAIAFMTCAVAVGTQSCSDDPEDVKVTGVTVDPESQTLLVDGTVTLAATVFPSNATDKSVTWESDNPGVATVVDGLVTARAVGTANITVTSVSNKEKTATCVITVSASYSVSLSAEALRMPAGAIYTRTLVATITPSDDSKTVTWNSSNTGVATVTNGVITAGATAGTATITATLSSDANTKAECTVTVVDVSSIPAGASLAGVWTFEDAANPGKATVGEDLGVSGSFTSVEGPGNTKAVVAGENAFFTIYHNIGANGGSEYDGEYTNEYTLMMDIRGSQEGFAEWLSVYNNIYDNEGEGALWIDGAGNIGFEALGGYSDIGLTPDAWHRVVIAVNLAEESFKVYIDGLPAFTASMGCDLDGEWSLYPDVVYIGSDGGGYSGPDFAEVMMWGVQLTAEQVAALGTPLGAP